MSLHEEYLKERESLEVLNVKGGFAIYKILEKSLYIKDIYVIPELRKTGLASEMADHLRDVAQDNGCTCLIGSVSSADKNKSDNVKILLTYGFKVSHWNDYMLYFVKGI